MTKNLEILQEAKKQYEQDLETVKEFVRLLEGNQNWIGIKLQTGCTPFKFKLEDSLIEYTVTYRLNYYDNNEEITFDINKEVKHLENPNKRGINSTLGIINISKGTFTSKHLKEFAKILTVYKDLIEEDFVTSARKYLA